MIKCLVLFITLIGCSKANEVMEEIRNDLDEIQGTFIFTFDASVVHVPNTYMKSHPCHCVNAFIRKLETMLDCVNTLNNESLETILKKLRANMKLLEFPEGEPGQCITRKRSVKKRSAKVLLVNIKFIQTWTEKCSAHT